MPVERMNGGQCSQSGFSRAAILTGCCRQLFDCLLPHSSLLTFFSPPIMPLYIFGARSVFQLEETSRFDMSCNRLCSHLLDVGDSGRGSVGGTGGGRSQTQSPEIPIGRGSLDMYTKMALNGTKWHCLRHILLILAVREIQAWEVVCCSRTSKSQPLGSRIPIGRNSTTQYVAKSSKAGDNVSCSGVKVN